MNIKTGRNTVASLGTSDASVPADLLPAGELLGFDAGDGLGEGEAG